MKVMTEAIFDKFSTDTGASGLNATGGIPSKLFFSEATEGTGFPYGTFDLISNTPGYVFSDGLNIENFRVQFDLFDDDSSAIDVLEIFERVKTLYDEATLTVTGFNNFFFRRDVTRPPVRVEDTWQITVDYIVQISQ